MSNKIKMVEKVVYLNVSDLIPYARNAKKHPDSHIRQLAASISEYGFNVPVLITDDNKLRAGHGRVLAAEKLGLKQVPCIYLSHLNDVQARAYTIADNQLNMTTGWDDDLLKLDLIDLRDEGVDLDLLGFSNDDFDDIFKDDLDSISDGDTSSDKSYTSKIESPIYTPTGPKPKLKELYNTEKMRKLIDKIDNSTIPNEEKEFLRLAAYRHNVFDYRNIAEYYAHSNKDVQELMEESALVIIDFKKAIENGFVKLSQDIAETYSEEAFDDE